MRAVDRRISGIGATCRLRREIAIGLYDQTAAQIFSQRFFRDRSLRERDESRDRCEIEAGEARFVDHRLFPRVVRLALPVVETGRQSVDAAFSALGREMDDAPVR